MEDPEILKGLGAERHGALPQGATHARGGDPAYLKARSDPLGVRSLRDNKIESAGRIRCPQWGLALDRRVRTDRVGRCQYPDFCFCGSA